MNLPLTPEQQRIVALWTLLLVDDEPDNLLVTLMTLQGAGATVITATSGDEALRLIHQHDFTAVLTDLSMPITTGWDLCRILRHDPKTKDLPIFAITAHAMVEDRQRTLNAGFTGYIPKPVDVTTFVQDLITLLPNTSHKFD